MTHADVQTMFDEIEATGKRVIIMPRYYKEEIFFRPTRLCAYVSMSDGCIAAMLDVITLDFNEPENLVNVLTAQGLKQILEQKFDLFFLSFHGQTLLPIGYKLVTTAREPYILLYVAERTTKDAEVLVAMREEQNE